MPYPNPQDTAGLARVTSQIEALRGELVPRLDRMETRMQRMEDTSGRIEVQVEKTNGRVTALELHDAHEEGAAEALEGQRVERRRGDEKRWQIRMAVFGAALGFATALATAVVLAYLTPLFPHP